MTIVYLPALLMFFVGMAALTVDVGVAQMARVQAQVAADAGALAGAYTYKESPESVNPVGEARGAAETIAKTNTTEDSKITAVPYPAVKQVEVTVTRATPTYFIKAFGVPNVQVRARATAEAYEKPDGEFGFRLVQNK